MGQGSQRNKPITESSVVNLARITIACRTCGRRFEIDPARAVTGVSNPQDTVTHCDRRCKKLAPAVVRPGQGTCQACEAGGPTVMFRSGITLCVPHAWAAFGSCLRKPRFPSSDEAKAALPPGVAMDTYPCDLCHGVHQTKRQIAGARDPLVQVQAAYARLNLDPESDRAQAAT